MSPASFRTGPSSRSSRELLRPLGLAAPLVAVSLGLAAVSDLGRHLGAALALLALGFLAWGVGVVLLERWQVRTEGGGGRAFAGGLLLAALLLRLPLLALPPTLSDDALRYVWDGRVAAAGANPYRLAPEAPELAPWRDELWQRLPHRSVPTVYPPLALGTFSIAASTAAPLLTWKALATAADLAACALLLALARRRGVPTARAAWYAWNPLVALEVAGMGHVDALAVAAAVAAVLALTPRGSPPRGSTPRREAVRPASDGSAETRPVTAVAAAAIAAAAGVLAKLGPLAAFPLWARHSRRPVLFLGVALALAAAGLLPVLWLTGGVPPGLVTYGVSWEFDGPLFEPLWRGIDLAGLDHAATSALDGAKQATGWHEDLNPLYPYLYPQFLAKLLLAVAALGVVLAPLLPGRGGGDAVTGSRRLFGGLLLCSATVYPWYLLWVLPWAAVDRHPAWLLASALAPLAYLAQHGVGGAPPLPLFPAVWALVWAPPAVLAAVLLLRRRSAPAPADAAPAQEVAAP